MTAIQKKEHFQDRLRAKVHGWCDTVELVLAILVAIVLVATGLCYVLSFFSFINIMNDTSWFQLFLKNIFSLVVGIEFIKMLLKPQVKNVLDVLIFLVARHLIIGSSTPLGMLICVVCIILLYGFWFFIKYLRAANSTFAAATDEDIIHTDRAPSQEAASDLKTGEA